MRYLIIRYFRKATQQLDESVSVARNIRDRDLQTAAVIVDFRKRSVIKSSFDGKVVPKDFDRIVSYYHGHYTALIDDLLKENNLELRFAEPENDTD